MGAATQMSVWHKSWCQDLQAAEKQQLLRDSVDGSCEAAFKDSGMAGHQAFAVTGS